MALQPGINCINLVDDRSHALALQNVALELGLPFKTLSNPRHIQPYSYLVLIAPAEQQELRIWLNRMDYACAAYTRLAWFPLTDVASSLPHSIDFAVFGASLTAFERLFTARQKAFSPFFDHIPKLAFKNALGQWTFNPE